jgi:hypothetical protein
MKFKPEGVWKNTQRNISMTLFSIPSKSDSYVIEYSENNNMLRDEIHLSNTNNYHWNLIDNDILGSGSFNFNSNVELVIRTYKRGEIKFIKE